MIDYGRHSHIHGLQLQKLSPKFVEKILMSLSFHRDEIPKIVRSAKFAGLDVVNVVLIPTTSWLGIPSPFPLSDIVGPVLLGPKYAKRFIDFTCNTTGESDMATRSRILNLRVKIQLRLNSCYECTLSGIINLSDARYKPLGIFNGLFGKLSSF